MAIVNYEGNRKYFQQTNKKPAIILIVVGFLFLLSGRGGAIVFGLLLAAAGGWLLYSQLAGRPTDHEIDRQAELLMGDLQWQALDKLGLDQDEVKLIDPIVVGGPYFGSLGRAWSVKRGSDGVIRSSNVEGVVIYFGEHELHSYKYQVSLVEPNERRASTDEYFYRDVVSVSTQSQSERVPMVGGNAETINFEVFQLTTSGGTSIRSANSDTSDSTSRAIQGARQLIRERKMLA